MLTVIGWIMVFLLFYRFGKLVFELEAIVCEKIASYRFNRELRKSIEADIRRTLNQK